MKPKFLFFLLALTIFFPSSLFSNTIYFPQVAYGGGYTTTFIIVNTGTTSVSGRVNFYTPQGATRPDLGTQVDIPAGNSTRFTFPNNGPVTTIVWGEFNAGAGTVQGVATFELRDGAGHLISTAGVLGIEGGNSFIVPIDVTASGQTGIAVGNASGTPFNIQLQLSNENGQLTATATDIRFFPVPAHGQVVDFITHIFPQLDGTTFKGSLIIQAGSGALTNSVAATALSVKEMQLSALPVIPGGSTGSALLEFPQVAFGGGYSTTFTLMNIGTAGPVASQLRFYDTNGSTRTTLGTNINIPVGGSARYTLPNTGPLTIAWAELIVSSGVVQGVATFDLRAPDGSLTSSAGVLGVQPANSFVLPVDITPSGGTGIAVSNTKDVNIGVAYRLIGETGAQVAVSTVPKFTTLGARAQVADFVTNAFPSLQGTIFKGALIVEAAAGAPASSLAATALTINEGLLSALPVIPGTIITTGGGTTGGGTTGGGTTGGGTTGGGTTGGGTTGGGTTGGGTTGGSGPASACFNPLSFTTASTTHFEILVSGAVSGNLVSDTVTALNVAFEGQTATEFSTNLTATYTGMAPTQAISRTYAKLDGSDILTFGSTTDVTTPVTGSVKSVYTPPARDKRYSLGINESTTQTYTATTTATYTGLGGPITQTGSVTETVKYLGRETVTVPAGAFDSCKFDQNNGAVTIWISAGSFPGVLVKSSSSGTGGVVQELQSGTINGTAIKP